VCKKEIVFYQNSLIEIDKVYQEAKKSYVEQIKTCSAIKSKIEEFIDTKIAYEKVLTMLKLEKQSINIMVTKKTEVDKKNKEKKSLYDLI
jgi:uncharacterized protein YPO0396